METKVTGMMHIWNVFIKAVEAWLVVGKYSMLLPPEAWELGSLLVLNACRYFFVVVVIARLCVCVRRGASTRPIPIQYCSLHKHSSMTTVYSRALKQSQFLVPWRSLRQIVFIVLLHGGVILGTSTHHWNAASNSNVAGKHVAGWVRH